MSQVEHDINHYERVFSKYSGIWAGEIGTLWAEYKKIRDAHKKLKAAVEPFLEQDGDLKSVHIPHAMFSKFREAMNDA